MDKFDLPLETKGRPNGELPPQAHDDLADEGQALPPRHSPIAEQLPPNEDEAERAKQDRVQTIPPAADDQVAPPSASAFEEEGEIALLEGRVNGRLEDLIRLTSKSDTRLSKANQMLQVWVLILAVLLPITWVGVAAAFFFPLGGGPDGSPEMRNRLDFVEKKVSSLNENFQNLSNVVASLAQPRLDLLYDPFVTLEAGRPVWIVATVSDASGPLRGKPITFTLATGQGLGQWVGPLPKNTDDRGQAVVRFDPTGAGVVTVMVQSGNATQSAVIHLVTGSVVPSEDADGDGLSDAVEQGLGTDPRKADTDSDGLSDGEEVALRTDPKKTDTDGDGLPDSEEIVLGLDPTISNLAYPSQQTRLREEPGQNAATLALNVSKKTPVILLEPLSNRFVRVFVDFWVQGKPSDKGTIALTPTTNLYGKDLITVLAVVGDNEIESPILGKPEGEFVHIRLVGYIYGPLLTQTQP